MRFPWLLAVLALLVGPALVYAGDPPKVKDAGKTYQIPYRLTDSGHLMVRVKINGKGPFNFIVDTGAPLVYVAESVAKKLGITAEKKGLNTFDKLELEGGPVHAPFKGLVETPFQLKGMNAVGLAGTELHGILGYSLLAHYKLEIDLTRDKMSWTKLDYVPAAPQPLGLKGAEGLDGLEELGKLLEMQAKLLGIKGPVDPQLRGFLGIELGEKDKAVVIQSVLEKSPAAIAGLSKGDILTGVHIRNKQVMAGSLADMLKLLAGTTAGQQLRFTVQRGNETKVIAVTVGEGL
jgi:serine protease DegQ